jgi:glucose-6-phosphate isomerase
MDKIDLWQRYRDYLCNCPELGLILDISRMRFADGFLDSMEPAMQKAFGEMAELEKGAIANPDEKRMVGHYWLRTPELSPNAEIAAEIKFTIRALQEFSADIHNGTITAANGRRFTRLLVVGIGGSALGPELVADALASPTDRMIPCFIDNTDPDGIDRVLATVGNALGETLTIVISKSGSTAETRNGMIEVEKAYEARGHIFARHAVAVTGRDSLLDKVAVADKWLARFPMWDWVGGRTSETSAVGLLPAALQGIDIIQMLEGASACDAITRRGETRRNPAALMALMWFHATGGSANRDMVVLPYKDRLILFSRYLQQLIMESIGKGLDRDGRQVNQGLTVYGNKGSTDQHAYVQQLREGINNFFVTFIEVLHDRDTKSTKVEPDVTSGDYLHGFLQGTRNALAENGRESMTITVDRIDPRTIGVLIALFERAVGLYASLININAYHQPGVEAGKKAAGAVLKLQGAVLDALRGKKGEKLTAEEIAAHIGSPDDVETLFRILLHLSSNNDHGITMERAEDICSSRFSSKIS